MAELGADYTSATVRAGHLTPDHAILATFLFCLCLVHISQSLAEVEVGLSL